MAAADDELMLALFKPTRGGWVYREANPWFFAKTTYYVVNDKQRTRIVEARR